MRRIFSTLATISALSLSTLWGQASWAQSPAQPAQARELAVVRITMPVMADGKPLAPGSYRVVLGDAGPSSVAGQPPGAQQWVEFIGGGQVAGRELAEVLRDSDTTAAGLSSQPVKDGVRTELLKSGDFLRISVKRGDTRYLVYLPVAAATANHQP